MYSLGSWVKVVASVGMLSFALVIPDAKASDEVEINGNTYSCTNRCVVTVTAGGYSVRDCCGG
ncbi:hypothetical protein, partial [Xanthomonas arboricola]|uniref:hypothetical protein n=1 Tax=Xanthomonas arboricola TaxID=56448 RepID=UPI001CA5C2C0